MQDLSKIEQEHLQANDTGDFQYTYKLTGDFAKEFSAGLRAKIIQAASAYFFTSGMDDMLSSSEKAECIRLLHIHISDAVGDMPIWEIVKRNEA